jgi:hypothetical protein
MLEDGKQVEGRAGEAVDPRHRHHVAGGKGLEHFEKLAPVGPRAGCLLAVNLGAARSAELRKLSVERLSIGADAGIAETAGFRGRFRPGFQLGWRSYVTEIVTH